MFESIGMEPRRIILGPMTKTRLSSTSTIKMANVKDLINLCIMEGGRVHCENNTPPMSMPTPKQDNKLSMVGCARVQATLLESIDI